MAALPAAEVNQQLWDETLQRLMSLSSVTMKQNAALQARVAELEVELGVWKHAHSVAMENSERESKAHNVQLATLNRQIALTDTFRGNQNPLILCVIDGDEHYFAPELLEQGFAGGQQAAQLLTQAIAEYLSKENVNVFGRLSFWITLFLNRTLIAETLSGHGVCSGEQFNAFLSGFSRASPRFLTVDVGSIDNDTSASKINEYLHTYTYFPQTLRLFFSGRGDTDYYTPTLNVLNKDQMLGKLVVLQGANDPTEISPVHTLPTLRLDGLFMDQKLPLITKKPLPPLTVGSFSSTSMHGGLMSPQSPARKPGGRFIDPNLPLHKQNPPPCNEHYLMTCSKGAGQCKYSHDYILTPEQLASLASNAKKAPCNWLKNGMICPYGDKCCWGHVCPNGPKCFHLSKGKCWFKGEAMHNPVSSAPSTPSHY